MCINTCTSTTDIPPPLFFGGGGGGGSSYLGEGDEKAPDGRDDDDTHQPEGDMLRPEPHLQNTPQI